MKQPKGKRPAPVKLRKEIKTRLILEDIAQGVCYSDLIQKYQEQWKCSTKTVECYIRDAMEYLRSDQAVENLKNINLQRLDNLYKESANDGDRKNALKAIDLQNKTLGVYEEKVEVTTNEPVEFVFNF